MTAATESFLAALTRRVDAVADGEAAPPLPAGLADEQDAAALALAAAVDRLATNTRALRDYSLALAEGRLDYVPPPRVHLLGPLKALQANLRHLTWQTQEVANGHLEHRVDFLGEFSAAFNRMIEALRTKQQAESEAMHASRRAGIGHLAAGLAHEINSPVQYMTDNLRYLEVALASLLEVRRVIADAGPTDALAAAIDAASAAAADQDVLAALTETIEGALAIGTTVQAMREFSQVDGADSLRTDLNRAVNNAVTVSRHAWQGSATVELRLDETVPPVTGRTTDICQVILQLVLNAAEAIARQERQGHGLIVITTRSEPGAVILEVADNGPGIPAELREKVFELFWTSRANGVGHGLGLPICRDIVTNRLGGSLAVAGEPGAGAVLIVRLQPAV